MKVYINRAPVTTPHGGGNKSLTLIVEKIIEAGHELVFDLSENIDVIFCFDPRPNNKRVWYQDFINYKSKNPRCKIIQRVGDVGTHSKPELNNLLKQIVEIGTTDYFIFPSEWARKMINHTDQNFSVIPNRPLAKFYQNRQEYSSLKPKEINIVTHHWSDNDKKGIIAFNTLQFADMLQTLEIANNDAYYEKNKIMGRHPSEAQVITYFIARGFAHYHATKILPAKYRPLWHTYNVVYNYNVIKNNHEIGIKVNF